MKASASGQPTYAVLFKTHFWDEFVARQFERLRAVVGRGDIYIVLDATLGAPPAVPWDKVVSITAEDLARLRLAPFTTHGSVLWYNNDYPQYVAMEKLPAYDYYLGIEYDVTVYGDVSALVDAISADRVDFLGRTLQSPIAHWSWFSLHRETYGDAMLRYLACFSVCSRRAMRYLLARRQHMGAEFAEGRLDFWPLSEAFLPNELRTAGMRLGSLETYGDVRQYDWWPPTDEAELPHANRRESEAGGVSTDEIRFVHPVLEGPRFVRSLLHHEPSLRNLLAPDPVTQGKLRRYSSRVVQRMRRQEVRRRLVARLQHEIARFGLGRHWYADAQVHSKKSRQRPTAHNAA